MTDIETKMGKSDLAGQRNVDSALKDSETKHKSPLARFFIVLFCGIGFGALIGLVAGGFTGVGTLPILFFFSGPIGAAVGLVYGIAIGIPTAFFTYFQRMGHPEITDRELAIRVIVRMAFLMVGVAILLEGYWRHAEPGVHNIPENSLVVLFFFVSTLMTTYFSARIFDTQFADYLKSDYPDTELSKPLGSLYGGIAGCGFLYGLSIFLFAVVFVWRD